MHLFIETIRLEDGQVRHADYHQHRLDETRRRYFPMAAPLRLTDHLPVTSLTGRAKWRLVYGENIVTQSVTPYTLRPITSLRCVVEDGAMYPYKSTDREVLDRCFSHRDTADEVLIIRNGLLTDTSIANIALGSPEGPWYTPLHPLLAGTCRARLIEAGRISVMPLTADDLERFSHLAIFNAMIPFGELVLPTECVLR